MTRLSSSSPVTAATTSASVSRTPTRAGFTRIALVPIHPGWFSATFAPGQRRRGRVDDRHVVAQSMKFGSDEPSDTSATGDNHVHCVPRPRRPLLTAPRLAPRRSQRHTGSRRSFTAFPGHAGRRCVPRPRRPHLAAHSLALARLHRSTAPASSLATAHGFETIVHCVPRPRRPSMRSPATQAASGRALAGARSLAPLDKAPRRSPRRTGSKRSFTASPRPWRRGWRGSRQRRRRPRRRTAGLPPGRRCSPGE